MLFYNQLTELTGSQFVLIAILEVCATGLLVAKKWKPRHAFGLLAIGLGLTFLSLLFVRGGYGGSYYRERMGWPFQFHEVMRDMEDARGIAFAVVPTDFRFDLLHFLANAFFWTSFPFLIGAFALGADKKKLSRYLPLCLLAVIVATTLGMSAYNRAAEQRMVEKMRMLFDEPIGTADEQPATAL